MQLTNYTFFNPKNHLYTNPIKSLHGYGLEYSFAFNGQEKDDEVSGAGNIMTATFWEYDARLGRRWNLDPKPNVWESEYSVMGGNPICMRDVNGDKWKEEKDCKTAKNLNDKLEKKKNSYVKSADKLEKRAANAGRNGNSEKAADLGKRAAEQRRGQTEMANSQSDIKALETSSVTFTFGGLDSDGNADTHMDASGTIVLGGEIDADRIHEIKHGFQAIWGNTKQNLPDALGNLSVQQSDINDERSAYIAQYFFDPSSVTNIGNKSTITLVNFTYLDITNQYVFDMYFIKNGNKNYRYFDDLGKYKEKNRLVPGTPAFKESILVNKVGIPFIK